MSAHDLLMVAKVLMTRSLPPSPTAEINTFLDHCRLWLVCLGDAVPYTLLDPLLPLWELTSAEKRPKIEIRKLAQRPVIPPPSPRHPSGESQMTRAGSHSSSGFRPSRSAKSIGRTLSVNLGYRRGPKSAATGSMVLTSPTADGEESTPSEAFPGIHMKSGPCLPQASSDQLRGWVFMKSAKRGLGKSSWKTVFLRIYDGCAYQYPAEPGASDELTEGCTRIITLEHHLITPLTKAEASGREFAFCLRAISRPGSSSKPSKPFYLAVSNPYDLQQWMKIFNLHIEKATQVFEFNAAR
ncbi:MAG: PH domain-containing protein [archaeon]|nr:PH domain-containing protein [archaeon]